MLTRATRVGISRVALVVIVVVVIVIAGVAAYFVSTSTTPTAKKSATRIAELLEGKSNDLSWNQAVFEGMSGFATQMNSSGKPVVLSVAQSLSTPTEDTPALQLYGNQNYTLIISAGATFQSSVSQVAGSYPKIGFLTIGGYATGSNQAIILPRGDQGGFIMGVASALLTQTGKVAIIGGLDVGGIALATKAFLLGVNYTNQNFGKSVTVINTFVGNFDDPAASQSAAATAVTQGAGVLFCTGDGITEGVAAEAKQANVPFLYNEFNATAEAPSNTYGGISFNWTPLFITAVGDWINNHSFTSGPYYYISFANKGMILGLSSKISSNDATIINKVYTNIVSGNIQVYKEVANGTLVYSPLMPSYSSLTG